MTSDISQTCNYQYSRIVAMVYLTFLLAATIMAYKVVKIGFILQPGSTLIYTFSFFLGNVYTETYGFQLAKKLIFESIFCGYLFAILITFINILPSPSFWEHQSAYEQVVGHILRFTNAGVIGYLLSAFLNIYLFSKLRYHLKGNAFWIISLMATSFSEATATFITGFITFWKMIPSHQILFIMSNALLFKILYGFIAVWPASFLSFLLKKKETY